MAISKKKAPAKKPAAKSKAPAKRPVKAANKSVMRARISNLTREVDHPQYFVLANGQPVKHVGELAAILDRLEDHVFDHHVRPDNNDFHNWIRDVFQDVELARKVAGVNDKRKLQLVIYKHMAGHE